MKKFIVLVVFLILFIFISGINKGLSDDITIVFINKETVEKIGPYPFSRDKYADFIESIYSYYSPKCVYFNLIISQYQQGSMESDIQLFNAIKEKHNIFFGARVSDSKVKHTIYIKSQFNEIKYHRIWKAKGADFPLQEIVQGGAYISISDVGLNKRGFVEAMPTVVQINSSKYLSTPLFLTTTYLDIVPTDIFSTNTFGPRKKQVKTDRSGWFSIDFNHDFIKYTYHDILNKKAHKELINQRIILVGIDFPKLEEHLIVNKYGKLPGVEVIANATQTLIDQFR